MKERRASSPWQPQHLTGAPIQVDPWTMGNYDSFNTLRSRKRFNFAPVFAAARWRGERLIYWSFGAVWGRLLGPVWGIIQLSSWVSTQGHTMIHGLFTWYLWPVTESRNINPKKFKLRNTWTEMDWSNTLAVSYSNDTPPNQSASTKHTTQICSRDHSSSQHTQSALIVAPLRSFQLPPQRHTAGIQPNKSSHKKTTANERHQRSEARATFHTPSAGFSQVFSHGNGC